MTFAHFHPFRVASRLTERQRDNLPNGLHALLIRRIAWLGLQRCVKIFLLRFENHSQNVPLPTAKVQNGALFWPAHSRNLAVMFYNALYTTHHTAASITDLSAGVISSHSLPLPDVTKVRGWSVRPRSDSDRGVLDVADDDLTAAPIRKNLLPSFVGRGETMRDQ